MIFIWGRFASLCAFTKDGTGNQMVGDVCRTVTSPKQPNTECAFCGVSPTLRLSNSVVYVWHLASKICKSPGPQCHLENCTGTSTVPKALWGWMWTSVDLNTADGTRQPFIGNATTGPIITRLLAGLSALYETGGSVVKTHFQDCNRSAVKTYFQGCNFKVNSKFRVLYFALFAQNSVTADRSVSQATEHPLTYICIFFCLRQLLVSQHLCNSRRQCRLPMIHMPDSAHIAVGLVPGEDLLFGVTTALVIERQYVLDYPQVVRLQFRGFIAE